MAGAVQKAFAESEWADPDQAALSSASR
ncbi:hypothetical protein RS9916_36717 [Synechococcus sp. RS9916]|nr:hypothetical protein RS9916_36717 [Synechococcus sp. RS9916]